MTEQPDTTQEAPTTCGNTRVLPDETTVTCGRPPQHPEEHFDDARGIAWENADDLPAGLTQEERAHRVLDRVGAPRHRNEHVLTLVQRQSMLLDVLGRRMHTLVENNMILLGVCKDAAVMLEGAPGASQYRIREAIKLLRAISAPVKSSLLTLM